MIKAHATTYAGCMIEAQHYISKFIRRKQLRHYFEMHGMYVSATCVPKNDLMSQMKMDYTAVYDLKLPEEDEHRAIVGGS